MDDDEIFKLNSLHRYTKRSKLVLEAHSHCEVPAGCGGAVLQWLDPAGGQPVRVEAQSPYYAEATLIDGELVHSGGMRLKPGPYLLSLTLKRPADPAPSTPAPWVIVHMTRRASGEEDLEVPSGCTRADGSWRATAAKPPDRWQFADFDDSSWQVLGACSTAPDGLESWALDRLNELIGLGSVPLAIPRGPHIWIRRRFELPR